MLGGNPLGVVLRLVLLSIIVGIVLSALGIHPADLIYHIRVLGQRLYHLGLPALDTLWHYFLLGAVVVVPIWIVARILGLLGGRRSDGPPR